MRVVTFNIFPWCIFFHVTAKYNNTDFIPQKNPFFFSFPPSSSYYLCKRTLLKLLLFDPWQEPAQLSANIHMIQEIHFQERPTYSPSLTSENPMTLCAVFCQLNYLSRLFSVTRCNIKINLIIKLHLYKTLHMFYNCQIEEEKKEEVWEEKGVLGKIRVNDDHDVMSWNKTLLAIIIVINIISFATCYAIKSCTMESDPELDSGFGKGK